MTGETLRFERRHARALATTAITLADAELHGLRAPSSLDRAYNDIQTETTKRRIDAAATTVLIDLDSRLEASSGGAG